MKVCVSSSGCDPNSVVDLRFGRCTNFVIFSSDTNGYTTLSNAGINSPHGAGIAAAQQVIDTQADAIVTGNIGPNAMELIKAAGIKIYNVTGGTVEEAVKLCLEGKLQDISQASPAHSGLGHQERRGW